MQSDCANRGKIPAIIHNGLILSETTVVLEYITGYLSGPAT
ncbi:hypothetical protein EON65_16710 [archaeon]|nr:MAG: hypothetical protein EON65_16710 [archaeon]